MVLGGLTKKIKMKKVSCFLEKIAVALAVLFYLPVLETKAQTEDEDHGIVTAAVNGDSGQTVLRDGDDVTISLDGQEAVVDSVRWYVKLDDQFRYVKTTVSADPLRVKVSPDLFCGTFTEDANAGVTTFKGGLAWEKKLWETDGICCFTGKVYAHDGDQRTVQVLNSHDFSLDLLPLSPTIQVIDAWPDPEDSAWPVAHIKIETDNFERGTMLVCQNTFGIPEYVDTVFTSDFCLEYTIYMGCWGDDIYCICSNPYGESRGKKVRISKPSSVISRLKDSLHFDVKGNVVSIENEDDMAIKVFSVDGKLVDSRSSCKTVQLFLPKGYYVFNVHNLKTRENVVKKLIVK